MKRKLQSILITILFVLITCFSGGLLAKNSKHIIKNTSQNHPNLPRKVIQQTSNLSIDQILSNYAQTADVGILIKSMDTGAVLYQKNASHYFMPASTMKVLTAVTALSYLGPDYRFTTKMTIRNPNFIQNGTVNGDVYIQFDGDPTLTRQDLAMLIANLSKQGIRTIRGNIYIDDFVFDQASYGRGWMWDELNICYAAPTAGIVLDRNCFWLQVKPTSNGRTADVVNLDRYAYVKTSSYAVTRANTRYTDCPIDLHVSDNNEYYFTGCISPKYGPINMHVAVKNMRLYTQNFLVEMLQHYQVNVTGKIAFAPSEANGYVLASHSSEPLSVLVRTMLKHSDNLIADSLYKKIAFYYFGKTGTWLNGSKAMKQILAKNAHINLDKAKIFDGSGLSRYNLITPEQMMAVLSYAYNNPNIRQVFNNALPISGIDGSLHWRMGQHDTIGKIHAKTGTMTGISSLAGYETTSSNKKLGFVIIFNSFPDSHHIYARLEDRICIYLNRL